MGLLRREGKGIEMNRWEFREKFQKEYNWLQKNSPDLLEKELPRGYTKKTRFIKNLTTGVIFSSAAEAGRQYGVLGQSIREATVPRTRNKGRRSCKGCHWAYCDETGNIIK